MESMQVFYKNEKVETIINLVDKTKIDLVVGGKMIRSANRSELMVKLEDAEIQINGLQGMLDDIRKIICSMKHIFY